MKLDANSFNFMSRQDLDDVFSQAQKFYMSEVLDRHLDNKQQVARAYVEAVLSVAVGLGAITILAQGKEVAQDLTSIEAD